VNVCVCGLCVRECIRVYVCVCLHILYAQNSESCARVPRLVGDVCVCVCVIMCMCVYVCVCVCWFTCIVCAKF